MRATRYRLRFISGVSLDGATYGSGSYGTQTYGQQATDPLADLHYRLIPLPAGHLASPSWVYRQGDQAPPFEAVVYADVGPLDLVAVQRARLALTPVDGRDPATYLLGLATGPATGYVSRNWATASPDDFPLPFADVPPGVYRVVVVLDFQSTRRLSLPDDDNHRLVITEGQAP